MVSVFIGELILAWGGGADCDLGSERDKDGINVEGAESEEFAERRGDRCFN
jgi:hypothetical protein